LAVKLVKGSLVNNIENMKNIPVLIAVSPEHREWMNKNGITPTKLLRAVIEGRIKKELRSLENGKQRSSTE
jgi:hypothetical protein